jgi:hypothetical protein
MGKCTSQAHTKALRGGYNTMTMPICDILPNLFMVLICCGAGAMLEEQIIIFSCKRGTLVMEFSPKLCYSVYRFHEVPTSRSDKFAADWLVSTSLFVAFKAVLEKSGAVFLVTAMATVKW